jgi:dienelactone hydrolase
VIYRKVVATFGVVLGLGLVGSAAGPGWSPEPFEGDLVVETQDLTIGGGVPTPPLGTYDVGSEIVDVELEGAVVRAEVTYPVGGPARERHPGIVFIHGAGTGQYGAFRETARALASAGIVAMVPAKRLDNYSTRERDYPAMARDYLASVAALRARPDVDPARVGVYGESEGGWIAPIAAAADPGVAFVVLVSSPVVPPREQAAFATDSYLRNVGVPDALLRAIPRSVGAQVPGGGFDYVDFDVGPFQREVTQPTLIVYGTADASMPTVQGAQIIIDDLAAAGNDAYTVRYVEGANHGIRVDGELVPEFLDALAAWVQGLPATATAEPRIAGAQPIQRFTAAPVDHPRWYANGDMLVRGLVAALVAVAAGPVLWLVAVAVRRRPRPVPPPLARWMAALALGVVVLLGGFGAYVYKVAQLALDYERNPVLVQGGWFALEVVAVTTAGVLVVSASRVLRAWRSTALHATGWISRITLLGVHGGSLGLLVVAAYWGLFPPVL